VGAVVRDRTPAPLTRRPHDEATVTFAPLPRTAAWRHLGARQGFEVAFFRPGESGPQIEGFTSATEDDESWSVRYEISLDATWHTRAARVDGRSSRGAFRRDLEVLERGRWLVDGVPAPHLDGCLDIDLESSACTNTLPIHRLRLGVGDGTATPAVYVRALALEVERLEQRYSRVADTDARCPRFRYSAPAFDFEALLAYDPSGLILDYPGIATRA
jgi:uncharacterized protein